MHAKDIVELFLAGLTKDVDAYRSYVSNASWTAIATKALLDAGTQDAKDQASKGAEIRAAARERNRAMVGT